MAQGSGTPGVLSNFEKKIMLPRTETALAIAAAAE